MNTGAHLTVYGWCPCACDVSEARFPRGNSLTVLVLALELCDVSSRVSQEEVCSLMEECKAEREKQSKILM